jgi:2-phospho-L-lactate guanylyltransferase
VVAVVPVRSPAVAKSRLAGVLSPRRRGQLVESMLRRVLTALSGAHRIDHVIVLTPDATLELPSSVERLVDGATGLNDAVQLAAARCAARFDAMLVIPADVPQVTAAEIDALVERARDLDVVVVPDRHDAGTNALWLRLPTASAPQFGADSARAHLELAQSHGLARGAPRAGGFRARRRRAR